MKIFYKLVVAFFISFLFSASAKASHVSGGDITYTCTGPNTYFITMKLFRDCSGTSMSSTASLTFTNSCGLANPTLTLNLQDPGTGSNCTGTVESCASEISQLCPPQIPNSTCSGGTLPGMQQYTYTGTVTFPATCNNWTIAYNLCCRNTSTNISGAPNFHIETTMATAAAPCNNSPVFTAQPVPYVCLNQVVNYNNGVIETDGDSLTYSLVSALQNSTTPVTYNAGYSGAVPIPGITINTTTGQVTFTPTTLGIFVVVMMIEEYRNGVLIGTVMRDIQFVVQNCTNTVPNSGDGSISNLTGTAIQTGPFSLDMCEGDNFTFNATFTDLDPSDILTLTSNVTTVLPGATFSFSGSNPVTATISWTAPGGSSGSNSVFFITVNDGACPVPGTQTMIYDINVLEGTYAGPDEYYCPAGGPIQMNVTGGSSFTWTPATGLSCTNCPNPLASPSVTTTYIVTSNLASVSCKNKDTVVVNVVPDFSMSMSPASATICKYGSVQLNVITQALYAPYTYSWSPTTGLSNPNIANPIASPLTTTTYTVTATSNTGCTRTGSVTVTVSGVAPLTIVTAIDTTICQGASTQLITTIFPDVCQTTTQACSGPLQTGTVGTGTSATTTYSPHYYTTTTAYSNRKQYLFRKAELDAMGFVGGGKITTIALEYTTANTAINGIVIKMGCTTLTEFPDGNHIPGLQTVKTSFNHTPTVGWNSFALTSPYMWDGQSNLIVEFCVDNAQTGTSSSVRYGSPGFYGCIYDNISTSSGACSDPTGFRTTVRPNMQFTYCTSVPSGLTYSWTPTTGLSNSTIPNPVASPTSTTTYMVSVADGSCIGSDNIEITVAPDFTMTMSPNATICMNNSTQLNMTPSIGGTFTYSWSPTTGLSNPNIVNPIASPLTTTTYTLTATSAAGCTKTGSVTVTISGIAPIVAPTATDSSVCSGAINQLNTIVYPGVCTTTSLACTGPLQTGTVGTGTFGTTTYSPHYYTTTTAYSNRKQYLFRKAELDAMGFVGGGKITTIALEYTTANTSINGIIIKMGCTSLTEFPDGNHITGLQTVKTSFNHTPTVGWNNFALTSPYLWDGQSNLIVEFCVDNAQTGTSSSVMYGSPGFYGCIYDNISTSSGACSDPTGFRTTVRPNMQFTYCAAVAPGFTYSWTPTTGLSSSTISNPTSTLTTNTTYTVTVSDGGACSGSGSLAITVAPDFTMTMSPNTTICMNNSTQLNMTPSIGGTFTYSWSPTTGLSNPNIVNPMASPLTTTTYTLTATSAAGCTKTGSVTVTISGIAPIVAPTASDSTVCPGVVNQLNTLVYPGLCTTTTLACTGPLQTGTVGTGTSATTTYSPHYMSTTAYSNRKQYLFRKAELDAMGFLGGGKITTIALEYTTANTSINGIVIKMGCTTLTEFPDGNHITGLQTVKTSFNHNPTVGWNTFTLTSPYLWDGQSNLVVEFCVDNAQTGTSSSVRYGSPGFYGCIYDNISTSSGACSDPTGFRTTVRPNMQFTYCAAVAPGFTYSWTPTTGLSSSTISNPTSTLTTNTTYTVTVSDGGSCSGSGSVSISIDSTNYVVGIPSPDTTVCAGETVQLGANVFGPPPATFLPSCGTNNTPCSQTIYTQQAGTGTFSSTTYGPFFGSYTDSRYQFLFLAADLTAAGITSGTIRELAWNVITKSSTGQFTGFTISMGCTNASTLTTTGWLPTTTVWGATNYTTTAGWNNFVLANPFDWDGVSNIVIETCYNNPNANTVGADAVQYASGVGYSATMRNYSSTNGTNGCTMTPSFSYTARPNMQFTVCPPVPNSFSYSWSPAGSVSNSTIANPTTTPTTNSTYVVTVTGGQCTVSDTVNIFMCSTLPIELLTFKGKSLGRENLLEWVTASEINNDYFTLERSADGIDFEKIAVVKGAGNSNSILNYSDIDKRPVKGMNYYRLKQTDFDGTHSYSEIVAIENKGENAAVHIYPNPSNNNLFVDLNTIESGEVTIEIYDLFGRLIIKQDDQVRKGANTFRLDISILAQGVYMLKVVMNGNDNFTETNRIVKY